MENYYGIAVIGAGGTGSLFLGDFCRFLSTSETAKKHVVMMVVDGDTVEEKNLSRQCFFPEDIGKNKAEAMAEALNDSFDLTISASPRYMETPGDIEGLFTALRKEAKERSRYRDFVFQPVLVSCVDNIHCRLQMEEVFRRMSDIYYIDSGNGMSDGQAIYALKQDGLLVSPMRDYYGADYSEADLRSRTQMSCEELNHAAPQHILTNRMAALNITRALIILCEAGQYMRGYASFDAFLGTETLTAPEKFGFKPEKRKKATTRKKAVSKKAG